jgi:hypothetical protein
MKGPLKQMSADLLIAVRCTFDYPISPNSIWLHVEQFTHKTSIFDLKNNTCILNTPSKHFQQPFAAENENTSEYVV